MRGEREREGERELKRDQLRHNNVKSEFGLSEEGRRSAKRGLERD